MDDVRDNLEWTLVIRPEGKWLDPGLRELWQYRDLVLLFVRRDFVAQFKQTILGPLWFVLQPLLTTLVFTVVFGNIAGLSTDGLPKMLFYLSGTVMWSYFQDCLVSTADTFAANQHLFGKVYFPRLAVPMSLVLSGLLRFGLQFAFFLGFMAFFKFRGAAIHLTSAALLTPFLVLLMAVLALGCGTIISSLTTKYRDLRFLLAFGVQLWMYATPVVYPLSSVPPAYRMLVLANPMTPVIETMRYAFLGVGTVMPTHLLWSATAAVLLLLAGLLLFRRVERTFMDTV